MEQHTESRFEGAKNFYLYLVSFGALMMIAISAASLIGDALKLTVFTQADNWYSVGYHVPGCAGSYVAPGQPALSEEQCAKEEDRYRQEQEVARVGRLQSSLVWALSVLIVGVPLFAFHWRLIKRK